jgi:uncharacterized SAM-binding protein YcdF (DUF218 family)
VEILLTKIVAALVLPPGANLLLIALGATLWARWRRAAAMLLLAGLVSLYVLSTPILARNLLTRLESVPALTDLALRSHAPGAIVVLGGGIYPDAPEYGADTLAEGNLPRLRYGAYLHRKTSLPLLVTGGRVFGEGVSEAALMKELLEDELGVPVGWVDERARNTAESARNATALLAADGVEEAIVITDASHMVRALSAFAEAGLRVVPAPVEYRAPTLDYSGAVMNFLPSVNALGVNAQCLHEYIGRFWYWLRY